MQQTFARVASALVVVAAGVSLIAQPGKAPLDKAAVRWVEQTLKKMTLDEKIGQLLVTSLNASFTSADSESFDKLRHLARDVKVGGVHVFGGTEPYPALMLNPTYGTGGASRKGDPYVAAAMLNRLQREAQVPLLTTADFEGGVGYILDGATRLPRAMAIGATRDADLAYRAGKVSAEEGRALGPAQAVVLARALGRQDRPDRDRPAVLVSDKDLLLVAGQRRGPLLAQLLTGRLPDRREDRRAALMLGQREVDLDQLLDLLLAGLADLDPRRQCDVARRDLLQRLGVLLAEAEAEPGIEEA